jgi:hypothetical protein
MATNFNKSNKYTAINIRNSHDTREVRLVGYSTANGYMFEDVTDGFAFSCKYANVGPITGHTQVVDVRRGGSHYKVATDSAH